MPASTLRILIGLFLIAHGWVHFSLTAVPAPRPGAPRTPFWPSWKRAETDPLWPASRLGLSPAAVRNAGSALWAAALAAFCIAGLGLIFLPGQALVWQAAGIVGAAASLILLVFYWHPWLVMGVVIDLAVIAGVVLRWPPAVFPQ